MVVFKGKFIFIYDNALVHASSTTNDNFSKLVFKNDRLLICSPFSMDLNPIKKNKNLWNIAKRYIILAAKVMSFHGKLIPASIDFNYETIIFYIMC